MRFSFTIKSGLHPDGHVIAENNIDETSSCLPTENERVDQLMDSIIPTIQQAVRAYVQHHYQFITTK